MSSNEPVRNECEVIYEMFHILNYWLECRTGVARSRVQAQLIRVSHRYCKVTGSNPVEVLTFSGLSGFYSQLLKLPS